jgi:Uma2 family endonuclease
MSAVPDLLADFVALERLLEAQPEGMNVEIVRGVWLLAPRPRFRHGRSAVRLASLLESGPGASGQDGTRSDWVFVIEPEIRSELAFSRLIPDLAGWRRSTGGWPGPDESVIELVPDWVAEVVSPSTEGIDRGRKCEAYGLMGVAWYWIVDPEKRTVDVFTNVRGRMAPERSLGPDDPLSAPPFPSLGGPVAGLFPD